MTPVFLFNHVRMQFITAVILRIGDFVNKYQLDGMRPKLHDLMVLHMNRTYVPGVDGTTADTAKNDYLYDQLVGMCKTYEIDISDLDNAGKFNNDICKAYSSISRDMEAVPQGVMKAIKKDGDNVQLKRHLASIIEKAQEMMHIL